MSFQQSVMEELSDRQVRNPSYSMRSLAKIIGVSPSLLSQTLSGSRKVTYRTAMKIIEGLNLDPDQAEKILQDVSQQAAQNKPVPNRPVHKTLSPNEFALISDGSIMRF